MSTCQDDEYTILLSDKTDDYILDDPPITHVQQIRNEQSSHKRRNKESIPRGFRIPVIITYTRKSHRWTRKY